MKKQTLFSMLTITTLMLSSVSPLVSANTIDQTRNVQIELQTNNAKLHNSTLAHNRQSSYMAKKSEALSKYFYIDNFGNVKLSASAEQLSKELGVSLKDANLMIQATSELPNVYSRGFVGLHINLGPKVRAMTGWAAGAFAGGYCAWHLKQFATNGVSAGVVAVISSGIGIAVKNAIEKHLRAVTVGANVPLISMRFTVYVP